MVSLARRRLLVGSGASLAALACSVRTAPRTVAREVSARVGGTESRDGAGVNLRRLVGGPLLAMLDPFLLLDEFHSRDPEDFIRGFPDHPHRGFETVSIMLDGHVVHRDSVGNHGDIAGGGVQWMTAGRGIIHSEMPRASAASGDLWGYQLWVNLPARLKMSPPRYQDLQAGDIPEVDLGDARARVLAGSIGGARGPIDGVVVAPTLLDLRLDAGAALRHPLPATQNAFVHVAAGRVVIGDGGREVGEGVLAVLGPGEVVALRALDPARVLLFAAAPIGEPVARRGPFVMNTDAEIEQAWADYRSGRLVG